MNKLLKILLIILPTALIFLFPPAVRAAAAGECEILTMRYIAFDMEAEVRWEEMEFYLCGDFTPENKAEILFTNLLGQERVLCMPEGTRLLGVWIAEGLLTLDVSGGLRGYGGSAYEQALTEQFLRNAAEVPGVTRLTLLIDGELSYLPEGTLLINEPVPGYNY